MPSKADVKTLIAKMTSCTNSFCELQEEFEVLFDTKPQIERLKHIFDGVEGKYREIKKLQESITNKLCCMEGSDDRLKDIEKAGSKVKTEYFKTTQRYSLYQKECQEASKSQEQSMCADELEPSALQAMTAAVTKMAEALQASSTKPSGTTSLERLPVPTWDGNRRTYATWKKEFNHSMKKYSQDPDEQLQRFRKAMPKQCWWSEQVKTCKSIDQAWGILDVEFEDKRKLMDSLLADINNLKSVKRDSKSLTMFATTIQRYVNDMGDNGCAVDGATESPFFMSQLLSKLDPLDNVDFGREMKRQRSEENVKNLLDWLHQEASLRSRGKKDTDNDEKIERRQRSVHQKRSLNNATSIDTPTQDDESCPLGCTERHLLPACPVYQSSTLSQRWEAVKKHQRCRKCLRASHHTNDCKKADGTSCDKCKRNHHRSLHNDKKTSTGASSNTDGHQATKEIANAENNTVQATKQESKKAKTLNALCPVQKVKVLNNEGDFMECLAMLDSGSNASLLSKRVAKQLGLTGPTMNLKMNLAGGRTKTEVSNQLQVTISSTSEPDITKSLHVYTVTKPCSNAKTVSKRTLEEFSHLKPVANKLHLSGGTVDLLIGTDFTDAFVDVHTLSGLPGEPIAKRNCFGWYTLGQFNPTGLNEDDSRIHSVDIDAVSAVDDIKKLLYQDQIGIRPTKLCTCTEDTLRENKFVKSVSVSTTLQDGRVNVRMPWKESGPPKRSNYDIALKRMYSSEKTFKRRDCFDIVENEVQKLIDQDFVIKVAQEEVYHDQPEWYLPLQAVFTPEKTTKVRLVFDASAKGHDGLSLNDYLEKGPNYINNLSDVLIAWRWDNVAYSGDIRKMFNQIVVHPDDQVYHRFLWRKSLEDPPTVYQWRRLSFGDKPAPDIATNSINLLAKLSQDEFPEASRELQDHAYVDDIAGSTSEVLKAKQIMKDIDDILGKGQFNIKAWHSNRKEIDTSNEETSVDLLGHSWDKESDKFSLKKDEIVCKQELLTKRHCLAMLAQLWDPIGLVAPVTVKFRIDLQDLWSSGFGWDDTLPNGVQQRWNENLHTMNQLLKLDFDRQLKPSEAVGSAEVHGFSDGGELAFGAVIFLRWQLSDGSYCCVPVMIKSFVAPLKKKSIPRLELLGCVTLVRMYDACTRALVFTDIGNCRKIFWVDSATVLSWVRTPPREFKPFVSARVAEIQETVDTESFRYVRSKSNPADALTRGLEPEHLTEWLQVPSFLQLPESHWPEFEDSSTSKNSEAECREVKGEKKAKNNVERDLECDTATTSSQATKHPTAVQEEHDNPILAHLLKNCSSFLKMRRTLAYVNRFISNTRQNTRASGPITVEELKTSEEQLIKWCQVHLNLTKYPELIPKEDGKGVVRAHGRLEAITSLPKDMRNPIILPAKHKLTDLILEDIHNKRGHCGYKSLVHESRRKFWIIGVRNKAKALTRDCIVCRKLRKKPLEQLMGQIPSLRVAVGQAAFTNTAMDMFGPLQIRLNRNTLKEAQVIIFTCMTTRAIHLELVTDRSSDTFLMAFRRLASLRGHPRMCYSDCGTNFIGAQQYLKEVTQNWDIDKIKNNLTEKYDCDFRWEWNVPHASHQNGVVESLIKSVRQALNATCKNQTYTEEQWRTILAEITYMVNGRPLYPSSDNIWEQPPITPNDILIGNHSHNPQPEDEERVNPRDLVRSTQHKVDEFWRCWTKYFAPNLLPRNKWYRARKNIQIGDLVLELDPKHKRSQWKMALIIDTYPGKDGLIRKVKIRTNTGEYDRPIHKLCLIATNQELNSVKN